ncbi:MAG: nucleotidyltransferase domain-containing protein [Anaerolineales bacterium]|nr:nucleotidyltransferase domain-containing protein [Anaerolineales bacterium]
MKDRAEILDRCKQILQEHYGPALAGMLLYGSVARGQAEPGSDLDLLVLLREPFDYFQELWQIVNLLYPAQLESEQLISAKPVAQRDFENGELQLYRNAKREGVLV